MANFYKKPFIYLPPKKKKKEDKSAGNVGIPFEYTPTWNVTINQKIASFWLTPFLNRTPTAPVLTLDGQDMYWNTMYSTSSNVVSMFSFERWANSTIPSLVNALGKMTIYSAGTGSMLNNIPFTDCYFLVVDDGLKAYKVNFTATIHEIFKFEDIRIDVSQYAAPDIYHLDLYRMMSGSSTNFNNLYSALDSQGVVPIDKLVRFVFLTHNDFTDAEVKNILSTYYFYMGTVSSFIPVTV